MFLSVSFFVFFAYRQGIKDSFYINNNLPLSKKEEESQDTQLSSDYAKMMNYDFEMAGEVSE